MKLQTKWDNLIEDNEDVYEADRELIENIVKEINEDIADIKKDEERLSVYHRKKRWIDAWVEYYIDDKTFLEIGEERDVSKNAARRLINYINRAIRMRLLELKYNENK